MTRIKYGSAYFTGESSDPVPNLLEDHQLYECRGAELDGIGKLSNAASETVVYSPTYGESRGVGVYTYSGSEQIVYKHVDSYYLNDVLVATTSTNDAFFVENGDRCYAFDRVVPYVFKADYMKKIGPIIGTDYSSGSEFVHREGALNEFALFDVDVSGGVVEVTSLPAHGLSTGDRVYIDGVEGITEVNGYVYTITRITDYRFTLDDIDGSAWPSSATNSTGTGYEGSIGMAAAFHYRVSYEVTLPDGDTVESDAVEITSFYAGHDNYASTEKVDSITLHISGVSQSDARSAVFPNASADACTFKARVWRTLSNGASYHLLKEIEHADIYEPGGGYYTFIDTTADPDMGAVLTWDHDSHGAPPSSGQGVVVGHRLYVLDVDNPRMLHFSAYGNTEHFAPLDSVEFPAEITAIGRWRNNVAVFSASDLWLYNNSDGVGLTDQVEGSYGCDSPRSVATHARGLIWANKEAAWLFDGTKPIRLTESDHGEIRTRWQSENVTRFWSVAIYADKVFFHNTTTSSNRSWVLDMGGRNLGWSYFYTLGLSGYYKFFATSADNTKLYGMTNFGVRELFSDADTPIGMILTTKTWGNGIYARGIKIVVDAKYDYENGFRVRVVSNTNGDVNFILAGTGERKIYRKPLPDNYGGEYFNLYVSTASGSVDFYGAWLEVDYPKGYK